jgi:hypothetical protein
MPQEIRLRAADVLAKVNASQHGREGTPTFPSGAEEMAGSQEVLQQQIRLHAVRVLAKVDASQLGHEGTPTSPSFESLVLPAAVTEDSTEDSVFAISQQPSGKEDAKKRTSEPSKLKSKPSALKLQQPIEIVRTPGRVATLSHSETIDEGFCTPERQQPPRTPSAVSGKAESSRKRVLGELDADASAPLVEVRRPIIPNDSLQSPLKKLKDESSSILPPLLGRIPWFPPPQEEEIVLDFELIGPPPLPAAATAESSATAAVEATAAKSELS